MRYRRHLDVVDDIVCTIAYTTFTLKCFYTLKLQITAADSPINVYIIVV